MNHLAIGLRTTHARMLDHSETRVSSQIFLKSWQITHKVGWPVCIFSPHETEHKAKRCQVIHCPRFNIIEFHKFKVSDSEFS